MSTPIPANAHPFKEMDFSAEDSAAITSFRAAIHAALSSSSSPSSPFHSFLASSPSLHTHWWSVFSTLIEIRHLHKRTEIIAIVEGNKKAVNGDDSKLREEEYDIDKKISDFDLLRFLRARKMHEAEALKMILAFIKWRHDFGIASLNLVPEMPFREFLMSVSPHMWHGVAKDRAPVYLTTVGEIDAHAFSSIVCKEMMMISHSWDMESAVRRLYRHSVQEGKRIPQLVFLMDFQGVSLAHAKCASAFKVTSSIDQDYYPELLQSMVMVNAPSFFPVLWSICKGFLDKKTQSKMQMYSAANRSKLLDFIDADQLAVEFGGSGNCSCKKHEKGKYCVPRKGPLGFWEFTVKKPKEDEGMELDESMHESKKITIKARRKFEATFNLVPAHDDKDKEKEKEKEEKREQIRLEWEYEVKHRDVQFSAEFIADYAKKSEDPTDVEREKAPSVSEDDAKEEEHAVEKTASAHTSTASAISLDSLQDHMVIHPPQRVAGKHKGELLLPLRAFGHIRFVFSNEYSRWNSKEVHFKITKQTVAVASS